MDDDGPAEHRTGPGAPADRWGPLIVDVCREDPRGRVIVRGDATLGALNQLTAVSDHLRAEGIRDVVLDLAAVTLLDSSGLDAIIELRRAVDARQGSLIIDCPPGLPRRVMEAVGLDDLIQPAQR